MISLTREPSDPETPMCLRHVAGASLSYIRDGKMNMFASATNGPDEKEFWKSMSDILERKDVTPCGWNMRQDIWPAVCANFMRLDIPCDRLQPISERWSKAMVCDLSVVMNQSAYAMSPTAVAAVEFLSGQIYQELDEEYRFSKIGSVDEFNAVSEKEHTILHRLLNRYLRLSRGAE